MTVLSKDCSLMVRKRARTDRKFQPKKCGKVYLGDEEDWISKLPDDIVVYILSLLSLKEAASTSVVSSRWINLWKHHPSLNLPYLNLDAEERLNTIISRWGLLNKERGKFVKQVNWILQSHKANTLKEFKIRFDLDKSDADTIIKCLAYAFARQVQRLEVDLSPASILHRRSLVSYYVFPQGLLNKFLFDFKALKELSLKYVHVTRESIDYFLLNCPLLEKLIVHKAKRISNLEVCGSSLKLKHLELGHFFIDMDYVKVSAPNLTSLILGRCQHGVVFQNVPMLTELSVTCDFTGFSLEKFIDALGCCISQLESLTLCLQDFLHEDDSMDLTNFPEMPRLKKLVIVNKFSNGYESLMELTYLIRASPNLEEFILQMRSSWLYYHPERSRSDREVGSCSERLFPHEHLKVVNIRGYDGYMSDVELLRYLIVNCLVLQKIIIDPRIPWPCGVARLATDPATLANEIISRNHAKQHLQGQVPHHIQLIIL